MKSTIKIFYALAAFIAVMTVIYGVSTAHWRSRVELVGVVGMLLCVGLCVMLAAFLQFVEKRVDLPEDDENAVIADGAGELGFFSPGSYWPFLIAVCVMVVGFGLAFFHLWIVVGGAVLLIVSASSLVFEYYLHPERH